MFLALMLVGYTASKFAANNKSGACDGRLSGRIAPEPQRETVIDEYGDDALGAEAWVCVPSDAEPAV